LDDQFAGCVIYPKVFDAVINHEDLIWVRMWLEIKGVFQSSLVTAVDQINPWIDFAIDYFFEGWYIRPPQGWVISDEIVDLSFKFALRFWFDPSILGKL